MITYFEIVGISLAVGGATISIIGNIVNTIWKKHHLAIQMWSVSAPMVAIWAYGFLTTWWNGGLSIGAILVMNIVFALTNFYALIFRGKQA